MAGNLKRIRPEEARLGMYIHALEGSWFNHPFWRRRFLLQDPADLALLVTSEVPSLLIDLDRGAKPAAKPAWTSNVPASGGWRPAGRRGYGQAAQKEAVRPEDPELARAREIVAEGKKAIKALFECSRRGERVKASTVAFVVDKVSASLARNPRTLIGVTRLKTKDEYTYLHSVAVCALMVNLGRQLGLNERELPAVGMAGLLHDVGKMAVADEILKKPGPLTDEEFEEVRGHPARGHQLLSAGEEVPEAALDVCLHHHEKMNGRGYPHGLTGDQISLHARMGAICDVYDALTSNRSYKAGWSPSEAITSMASWTGHFDPELLKAFYRSIGVYPTGALLRMRSNRLAVGLDNGRRASRTLVRVFYAIPERRLLDAETVELSDTFKGDQVVGIEDPAHWHLGDWDALRERLVTGKPPTALALAHLAGLAAAA